MPTDEQIADSSAAAEEADQRKALYSEEAPSIDSWTSAEREAWLATGDMPHSAEASAASTDDDKTAAGKDDKAKPETASESATESNQEKDGQQQAPPRRTGESRKAELAAEIQDLLKQRKQLRTEVSTGKPGDTAAPPAEKPAETKDTKLVEPKVEDFKTFEEYISALARHNALVTINEERAKDAKAASEKQVADRNREIETGWKKRVNASIAKHADFVDVAFGQAIPINQAADGFILHSDHGAEILYKLGSNLAEAERISQLGPFETIRELIKLEGEPPAAAVVKPPDKKKTTQAPPPPTDLKGTNVTGEDEAEAALKARDFTRYQRIMNARETKRN